MVMYAGQGVGLITEILPAAEIVTKLVEEAKRIIQQKFSHDIVHHADIGTSHAHCFKCCKLLIHHCTGQGIQHSTSILHNNQDMQ